MVADAEIPVAAGDDPLANATTITFNQNMGPVADENAFVTALAVDLLGRVDPDPAIAGFRQRGPDFLLQCEWPGQGGFAFYAASAQPVGSRSGPRIGMN